MILYQEKKVLLGNEQFYIRINIVESFGVNILGYY